MQKPNLSDPFVAPETRVFVALDVDTATAAVEIVYGLDRPCGFKIGLELYNVGGSALVQSIRSRGRAVFLDLKLHDIPETVRRAARAISRLGVDYTTVHTCDGVPMLEAAVQGASEGGGGTRVLGVTVLTSMEFDQLQKTRQIGPGETVEDVVRRRALDAKAAGCDGVVASAKEAKMLRELLGQDFLIVTPGIRASTYEPGSDDQKRVGTAMQAIEDGASALVIGRPICQAKDMMGAFHGFVREIESGIVVREAAKLGAVIDGSHFVYTAGGHGPAYVAKDLIARESPGLVQFIAQAMSWACHPNVVVAPEMGAIPFGRAVASIIGVPFVVAKKAEGGGFAIDEEARSLIEKACVLAVEDIVNSKKSIGGALDAIRAFNPAQVHVTCIWNRGGATAEDLCLGQYETFFPIVNRPLPIYPPPSECPLCAKGVPIDTRFGHGKAFLERLASEQQ